MIRFKSENGSISIFWILLLTAVLPFVLFIVVGVSSTIQSKLVVDSVFDNAVSAAVTCTDKDSLAEGKISFELDSASESVTGKRAWTMFNDILRTDLGIEFIPGTKTFTYDGSNSILVSAPELKWMVIIDDVKYIALAGPTEVGPNGQGAVTFPRSFSLGFYETQPNSVEYQRQARNISFGTSGGAGNNFQGPTIVCYIEYRIKPVFGKEQVYYKLAASTVGF